MRPLRIGIACYPTYGGSGVMATELGLALADRGHDVHLFSYERPMRLPACHHGITFHPVTVSSYPLFKIFLKTEMLRVSPPSSTKASGHTVFISSSFSTMCPLF